MGANKYLSVSKTPPFFAAAGCQQRLDCTLAIQTLAVGGIQRAPCCQRTGVAGAGKGYHWLDQPNRRARFRAHRRLRNVAWP